MVLRIIFSIFIASFLAALASVFLGYEDQAKYVAAPALVFSGWAAIGHLLTLDDDAPGEWSNPEGSKPFWRKSMFELILKFLVFASVGIIFYA